MSRGGVIGVSAAAVLVMAALVVASASQGPPLLSRPRSSVGPEPPRTTTLPTTPPVLPTATSTGATGWDASPLVAAVIGVVTVLVAALLIALLVLTARSALRRTRPQVHTHATTTFDTPPVPGELLAGAEARLSALGEGDPRNAIVAAWIDLEVGAGAAGLPRHPAETSTEYTTRVLSIWDVDEAGLAELAALYREARFSTHALDESHRARAIASLRTLHADLGHSATRPGREGADA